MTTANDIAFGCEFETTMPAADTTPIGPYHCGVQVPWLPQGWKAERDGSIQYGLGRKPCEFISPKLQGLAGLQELMNAVTEIERRGGKVNPSCGLHITVTWNGDAGALARLLTLMANHEKAFFAATGTRRRETGNWCKALKTYGSHKAAEQICKQDRYHGVNLTHLANGRNRIEFRLFAGTLSPIKVAAYLMMVLGLVEMALSTKRAGAWDCKAVANAAKHGWARKGLGLGTIEINRFFFRMGWTKGTASKVWGVLDGAAGMLDDIKKELRRLAAKYDLT